MEMSDVFVKLKIDATEAENALKTILNAMEFLMIICKRAERKRMRELVYNYGYIRDYLKSPVKIEKIKDIYGKVVMVKLNQKILSRDEEIALSDWMKVLEGYNPLWTWKMINDFKEEKKKMEAIKKYDAVVEAFLG